MIAVILQTVRYSFINIVSTLMFYYQMTKTEARDQARRPNK